jgi:prolyl oligopeptidase
MDERSSAFSRMMLGASLLLSSSTFDALTATRIYAAPMPPVAEIHQVDDDYFGIRVGDPYRYMENAKDPEVQAWMKSQASYTHRLLNSISGRKALLADIESYGDSVPARVTDCKMRGRRLFYLKRLRGEQIEALYERDSSDEPERLLLDPMAGSLGGIHVAISGFIPSWDGDCVAVGLAAGGSEASSIRTFDVGTGNQIGTAVEWTHFWLSWLPDGSGFFYRMTTRDTNHSDKYRHCVLLHRLRDDSAKDRLIFGGGVCPSTPIDPTLVTYVMTNPGSNYVVGQTTTNVGARDSSYYVASLQDTLTLSAERISWRRLSVFGDHLGDVVLHQDLIYFTTPAGAPNYQVMEIPASNPDITHAKLVIQEQKCSVSNTRPGEGLFAAADALYVTYLNRGMSEIIRLPYGSTEAPIALPYPGAIHRPTVDPSSPGIMLEMTAWTRYGDTFAFSPASNLFTSMGLSSRGPYDDPKGLVDEEVDVAAKDGVGVPLSIVHLRDTKLDGERPTILWGYGSAGISTLPRYSPEELTWFNRGGVLAFAHVRGGGEYGLSWHLAGQKQSKQNTWNDAIACAEYLVNKKYASPSTLGIEGESAGGILVGRAITERPDLFAVAMDHVPMTDTLRYEFTPNGEANVVEFGSVKTEEGFKELYAMSPYHHVKKGTAYPAVLVTAGINDPRVALSQPAKFVAILQAATASSRPVLLRVDYDAGHYGIGSTQGQRLEELADSWSFALWQFGDPHFRPVE